MEKVSKKSFKKDSLAKMVADNLNMDVVDVSHVINEFTLLLHKEIFEYEGINGDFIGEEMPWRLSEQSYFHLVGFLYNTKYNFTERGMMNELLMRLGTKAEWQPYIHQTYGWKERGNE